MMTTRPLVAGILVLIAGRTASRVNAGESSPTFELNPLLNESALAAAWATTRGHLLIPSALSAAAAELAHAELLGVPAGAWEHRLLASRRDATALQDSVFHDGSASTRARAAELLGAARAARAAGAFAFSYRRLWVKAPSGWGATSSADERARWGGAAPPCEALCALRRELLESPRTLALLARVTRAPRPLRLHSAFASEFGPGDFLSAHNDLGDGRAIAFTLNLARDWTAELGGALVFVARDGGAGFAPDRHYAPRFNVMQLFDVSGAAAPLHFVSEVVADLEVNASAARRLAVTGWFAFEGG